MAGKTACKIGLECHVELATATKLFCRCRTATAADAPNTVVCPTCLGMPGAKPVLNSKVVEHGIALALALGCTVASPLVFSRKVYFYPDLAKNYQITQHEMPLGNTGMLAIPGRKIGITRVHIEEDPAALTYPPSKKFVQIDYNRSGHPLLEIVTEPDMAEPEQAKRFLEKLRRILLYLEIFRPTGRIKADVNVSIKESGYVRAEIKNVTGFKEIANALAYEVERQQEAVAEGEKLSQETRGWDTETQTTYRLREKETSEDYGYIIDPDLVPINLPLAMIKRIEQSLPELEEAKVKKFVKKFKLTAEDAQVLAQEKLLAELFERVAVVVDPLLAARWLRRELVRVMRYNEKGLHEVELDEEQLKVLLNLIQDKKITNETGKRLLEKLLVKPFDVLQEVQKKGLEAISSDKELEKMCKAAIKEHPTVVEDYKKGKREAVNYLVGQVMRKTKGKASPNMLKEIFLSLLK